MERLIEFGPAAWNASEMDVVNDWIERRRGITSSIDERFGGRVKTERNGRVRFILS
jgi:hypothetical protein